MDKEQTSKTIEALKKAFNPLLPIKAYLHYFSDFEQKLYEEVALNEIPQTIDLVGSEESQILTSPAMHKNGIPVFVIGRGYPISIDFTTKKDRNALIEETMSSFQLNAWLNDTHIANMVKPKRSDNNVLYSAIFAIISAVFITLFITYVVWGG